MNSNKAVFFSLEDAPQIYMQIKNSILIGKSWTWIMVLSPMISIYGLLDKFSIIVIFNKESIKKNKEKRIGRELTESELELSVKKLEAYFTLHRNITGMCCILLVFIPLLMFVLENFEVEDLRP